MAEFKVVLSDPSEGKSYAIEATGGAAGAFVGKSVGDVIGGEPLGLAGYKIAITGGTDRTGIPARGDLPGSGRRKILIAKSIGFRPTHDGQRQRKSIRAAEITGDFVQINAKVVEFGKQTLKEHFAPPAEETPASKE